MTLEDQVGMIDQLFNQKDVIPARIRAHQVESIKPITREQVWKRLWQFSAEEQKEIVREAFKKVPKKRPTPTTGSPAQIHTLQIVKRQEGTPTTRIRAVKTKPATKKQVKEKLLRHNLKERNEIALDMLKGIPKERLTPTALKLLRSARPVTMGNIVVQGPSMPKPKRNDQSSVTGNSHIKKAITRIRAMSTSNLTMGRRIAKGYVALVARIEECEIDEELAQKTQNSQRIQWDYRAVTLQQAKLKKLAKKDPELGRQKLKTYKMERQKVACNEGRLPQNAEATFEPSDPLENQDTNALYIPMHARTKLGTHVIPALIDTGATQNFLSTDTAEKLGLTWKEDNMPKTVANADGSKCGTGMITQYCDIPMKLDNLWKEERFYKAETGTDQVVLGIPWLANFQPTIDWTKGTVTEVLEVPLHVPTRKVKKKISWEDESSKPAPTSIKEEESNPRINGN